MPKVILIHPAAKTFGCSFVTPRAVCVIANATPTDPRITGIKILDMNVEPFKKEMIDPGDIVGISITTGNCLVGYHVGLEAKRRGATVIFGGIHATICPEEPLNFRVDDERVADAVVTGNGDEIWSEVVYDALAGKLRKRQYKGGQVPGERLKPARWDLLKLNRYMFPSISTKEGCPENCNFCSVWTTAGRIPRLRPAANVIPEMIGVYNRGFRFVVIADDNVMPATLGRIEREPSPSKKEKLKRIRKQTLEFCKEFGEKVPPDLITFVQVTSEIAEDPECLEALYKQLHVRAALIGVESPSDEGLKDAGKEWNPRGQEVIETIRTVQQAGIFVLSSYICGLEHDTPESIQERLELALATKTAWAQFAVMAVFPGTKFFFELLGDLERREEAETNPFARAPVHKKMWITNRTPWLFPSSVISFVNSEMKEKVLVDCTLKCWKKFYAVENIFQRADFFGWLQKTYRTWYLLGSRAFYEQFARFGIATRSEKEKKAGWIPKLFLRAGIIFYNLVFKKKPTTLAVSAK